MHRTCLHLVAIASLVIGSGCSTPTDDDNQDPQPPPETPDTPGEWATARPLHDLPGSSQAPIVRIDAFGDEVALWQQLHPEAPYQRLWASRRMGADWEAPTLVANDSNLGSPLVVAGDASNALAAWRQSLGTENRIVATSVTAEGAWSAPVVLRSSTWQQGSLLGPRLAADTTNAVLVWGFDDAATHTFVLEGGIRKGSASWFPLPQIALGGRLASYLRPLYDVAFDDAGQVVVTWVEQFTDRAEIWARRGAPVDGSNGVAWEAPTRVATLAGQPLRELWTGTHAGRSYVAWLAAGADDSLSVAVSHRRPDGSWDPEQPTSGILSSHYAQPVFAAGADGHKVVLWREALTDSSRMVARTYDPERGWSDTQVVADQLKPPYLGCIDIDAYYFDVAIDDEGNVLAVWEERLDEQVQGRSKMGVWSSQYLAGTGWQAPLRVDGGNGTSAPLVGLAPGSSGVAIFEALTADGRIGLATNQFGPATAP